MFTILGVALHTTSSVAMDIADDIFFNTMNIILKSNKQIAVQACNELTEVLGFFNGNKGPIQITKKQNTLDVILKNEEAP